MEKRSTHWADVLNWLKVVVDSCKTKEQADTCMRLIQNFERIYERKIGISNCMDYLRPLKQKLWDLDITPFFEKMKKN